MSDDPGMGHEVLSSRGDDGPTPASSGSWTDGPVEFVELDDGDPVTPAPPAPAGPAGVAWRSQGVRLVAVAVGAAVLSGALVQKHASDERGRESASVLAASASVSELRTDPRNGADVIIQLTARVQNYGPAPVRVEPGGDDGRTVGAGPDGVRVVPAGGALVVPVSLVVRCGAGAAPPPESVALTTTDGRAHEVPLLYGFTPSVTEHACPDTVGGAGGIDVSGVMTGTLQRPILRLISRSPRPVLVRLEGGGPSSPDQPFPAVRITTSPRLPLRLPARGRADVVLQLTPDGCVRDVDTLKPLNTMMLTASADAPDELMSLEVEGFAALVGAAVARACATADS